MTAPAIGQIWWLSSHSAVYILVGLGGGTDPVLLDSVSGNAITVEQAALTGGAAFILLDQTIPPVNPTLQPLQYAVFVPTGQKFLVLGGVRFGVANVYIGFFISQDTGTAGPTTGLSAALEEFLIPLQIGSL